MAVWYAEYKRLAMLRMVADMAEVGGRIRVFNATWKCWGFSIYLGEKKDQQP